MLLSVLLVVSVMLSGCGTSSKDLEKKTEPKNTTVVTPAVETLEVVIPVPAPIPAPIPEPDPEPVVPQTITVYKTKTGAKYHLEGCSSLSQSKIPISLNDAKNQGLTPCKNCNPPQ